MVDQLVLRTDYGDLHILYDKSALFFIKKIFILIVYTKYNKSKVRSDEQPRRNLKGV